EATRSGLDLLDETRRGACVALAEDAEVHGKGVRSLQHPLDVPRSRCAGRGRGPRRRARSAAQHGGDTGVQRLLDLLRTDVVEVRLDPAGGDDLAFTGDHFGARSDDDVDIRLHIGVAGLADGVDASVPDGDIGFRNSPVIENQRVGDDRIHRALAARALRLTHAVADDFPAAELHLLALGRQFLLYFDAEIGICEANFVADRRAEHLRIGGAAHGVGHADYLGAPGSAPMTAWLKP